MTEPQFGVRNSVVRPIPFRWPAGMVLERVKVDESQTFDDHVKPCTVISLLPKLAENYKDLETC